MAQAHASITGIGLITPVGLNTDQSCAAIRAGVSAYEESEIYNKRFAPMTLAMLPEDALPQLRKRLAALPGLTSRCRRMLRLAHLPLLEALATLKERAPLPLFLAGPQASSDQAPAIDESFLGQLAIQTGAPIDLTTSQVIARGRAGSLLAAQAALACLAQGQYQHVLLGGVDTYLDLMLLGALDQEDRVLADGVMDGFAPGESAGFVLLSHAPQDGAKSVNLVLHAPGLALEAGHRGSEQPYTGDGLADAVRAALPAAQGQPIGTVFSSMNGENHAAKEWGVALGRNAGAFDPDVMLEHPADCVGDTGAACGMLLIALAATGLRDGAVKSPVLAYCSSDGPERVAICITAPPR